MKNTKNQYIYFFSWLCFTSSACFAATTTNELSLSQAPFNDEGFYSPSLIWLLDNSGSMRDEMIIEAHYTHYHYTGDLPRDKFKEGNQFYVYPTLKIECPDLDSIRRIFPNPYPDTDCKTLAENPKAWNADWRIRDAHFNHIYFNPNVTYDPWPGYGNANFNCAKFEEIDFGKPCGSGPEFNLNNFEYSVSLDDRGINGSEVWLGAFSRTPNGLVDLWDTHYDLKVSSSVTGTKFVYNSSNSPAICNPTVESLTSPPYKNCFSISTSSMSAADIKKMTNNQTTDQLKQNIANWFQYYRTRFNVAILSIAKATLQRPEYLFGFATTDEIDSYLIEPKDPASLATGYGFQHKAHNDNLVNQLFKTRIGGISSARKGLQAIGEYYRGNRSSATSPFMSACQAASAVVMTDGHWNDSDSDIHSPVSDNDSDGHSKTFADIAHYYRNNDLSPLSNRLPAASGDTFQHLKTFAVAIGLQNTLVDTDGDGWPNPILQENDVWGGNPLIDTADEYKMDNVWHGAFNGGGAFMKTSSPQDLNFATEFITGQMAVYGKSFTRLAANQTKLDSNTLIYQAKFDAENWSGALRAFSIDLSNYNLTEKWNAADLLDAQPWTQRKIFSYNPISEKAIEFNWPSNSSSPTDSDLSSEQINYLLNSYDKPGRNNYGKALVAYLKGDRSEERDKAASNFEFRARDTLLGDIVHSDPLVISEAERGYPEKWKAGSKRTDLDFPENNVSYLSFTETPREPMIYVGANDGMLHGFNAETGKSKFGYIPAGAYPNLSKYSLNTYTHHYYVNGPTVAEDVLINNKWRTILAGTLGAGGQSFYVLDVTEPDKFGSMHPDDLVVTEVTDRQVPELGYIIGKPTIARLADGNWYAITGNGFNNSEDDGYSDPKGEASLILLNLSTLATTVIKTGEMASDDSLGLNRPNGLSTPTLVDFDYDFVIDYVFAGDLYGNLWKFDLTSINPNTWKTQTPIKLFTTKSSEGLGQPITAQPSVESHPIEGFMVIFGTGKLLEVYDNTEINQMTQSIYGIWDRGDSRTVDKSRLLKQEFTEIGNISSGGTDVAEYRISTDNTPNWNTGDTSFHLGWQIDLKHTSGDNKGERVLQPISVRSGHAFVSTYIPPSNDCNTKLTGWTLTLDAISGARPKEAILSINGDTSVDNDDEVAVGSTRTVVSGINFGNNGGAPTQSLRLKGADGLALEFFNTSEGDIKAVASSFESEGYRAQWNSF